MKREQVTVPTFLMAVLLAVLISFSAVMCLRDAFLMDGAPGILLIVCVVSAVLGAVSVCPRRSWPMGLMAAVLYFAVLIWKREPFLLSIQSAVHAVTFQYAQAFDAMRVVGQEGGETLWILLALAGPMAWITAWVNCREGSALLVLLLVMPVFVLVLLVVDLAPVLWLVLLTGGLMLLLLSHSVRERSPAEGSRLAWWLVLPTIILVSGITVLWPPADYVRADWSQTLQKLMETKTKIETRVETWQQELAAPQPKWSRELKTVDLRRVGPKKMTGQPVLEYRADEAVSYLRGVSLAVYEDNSWNALPSEDYDAYQLPDEPLLNSINWTALLEVETLVGEPQMYTAYYLSQAPENGALVDDAYIQNTDRLKSYCVAFEPYLQYPAGTSQAGEQLAETAYTQIPEDLRGALEAIVMENGLAGASAETVAAFVRDSGVYDLNTPSLPSGEDFVLYFLQQSHRGYCIHFASATVMLLRSVGIPARYVTGYSVSGEVGQWNQVTEDDAHAWVEYYTVEIGWRPLDPTPAAGEADSPSEPESDEPDQAPEADQPELEQEQMQEQTEPAVPAVGEQETAASAPRLRLPKGLLWLLVIPGLLLLIGLRRWFGLRYRWERCRKGQPNRRALAYWRWLLQLNKVDSRAAEEDLLCLAEKARFSQHTMEESEIDLLRQAVEERIQSLQTGPLGKRLWCKYGLALF